MPLHDIGETTMPKIRIVLALSILMLAVLACSALVPGAEPKTEDDVPRVVLEEALVALHGGAAIFVDVRSADAFASSHIAGAINFPVNEIEANPAIVTLDKDQWIITYCT